MKSDEVVVEIDAIATELIDALDHTALLTPLTDRDPGFSMETAYAVSAEVTSRRRARGERPIGRKLGFTNSAIWSSFGLSAPIWAPVYDSTVQFLDGASGDVSIGHLAQPRLEPEIVLHFRSAPPVTSEEEELLAHIDWIAPGLELVQSHFPDWRFQTADAIAAFGVHGCLLVGPHRTVANFRNPIEALRTFTITLARDGAVRERGGGALVLGSPLLATAHILAVLARQPDAPPIAAGEIVTTGTLTAAVPVRRSETWTTDITGIELHGLSVLIS